MKFGRVVGLVCCFMVGGCLPPNPAPLPGPTSPGVAQFRVAARVVPARVAPARVGGVIQFAPDTLVMVASWTNPPDDGKGPIDSLRVRFLGIQDDTSYTYRLPFPTTQTRRQLIPVSAYTVSGSAPPGIGWDVHAEATTYRRGTNAPPIISPLVRIFLLDAPPPNVGGFTFTAVKRP